ncbi:MAG: DUF6089 family protein [Chitinophagales bacterium]|nr:hypothetical protein [Bacteroidota bacterium]MCB9226086.1 hypothetical protein [Chitinophagales bacterium]
MKIRDRILQSTISYSVILFLLIFSNSKVVAQNFEVGGYMGVANYFGDLNSNSSFNMVRPVGGVFLRNNFDTRWVLKSAIGFGQIAYDDKKSQNAFNRQRNLHFKSNILDLSVMLELNFLEFDKQKQNKWFSPYFTVGFAAFYYNPQAKYNGKWYYLQPLGTEGQNDPSYSGIKKYRLVNFAIPIGGGVKFSVNRNWNVGLLGELRVTFTDYLDDVSGVYPSPLSLPEGSQGIAYALSDRSGEVGEPIGKPGNQRGTSLKNDFYLFLGVSASYTFFRVKCPPLSGKKR